VLAAKQVNAVVVFDCMEFYSDMGDMQTSVEKAMICHLESQYLQECDLVLASSDEVSVALVQAYHIRPPTAVYNVPPLTTVATRKACSRGPFRLYWRNSVVGLGERGLEDVLRALPLLPESIELHLQGRSGLDGGRAVRALISNLNLVNRVYFHAPHEPHEAVVAAANYSVGLCLERKVNRNHEFTVSNKIFDYLMAGLPVVASNVAGLRRVIARSGGGILYEPGSVTDLAAKIAYLHSNPTVVDAMSKRGQQFAIAEGNWERERGRFIAAINDAIQRRFGDKDRRQV
jgi:glycosyltransferase involved in cell wall biosynthesis